MTEHKTRIAGCTCGSGAHPRQCAMHPARYQLHIAGLNLDNLLSEDSILLKAFDELESAVTAALQESEGLSAKFAAKLEEGLSIQLAAKLEASEGGWQEVAGALNVTYVRGRGPMNLPACVKHVVAERDKARAEVEQLRAGGATSANVNARVMDDEVITANELAKIFRMTKKTVYAMIKRDEIPGVRRLGRVIRIHRTTAVAWLSQEHRVRL